MGARLHVVPLDVTDENSIIQTANQVGEILSQIGQIPGAAGLDYLIQNAAVVSVSITLGLALAHRR